MWWDTFRSERLEESPQTTDEGPIPSPVRRCQGQIFSELSPREVEIVRLVAAGLTDKGIAMTLGIRTKTVSKHLEHIRRKMGCASRTEVGVAAVREGLIA